MASATDRLPIASGKEKGTTRKEARVKAALRASLTWRVSCDVAYRRYADSVASVPNTNMTAVVPLYTRASSLCCARWMMKAPMMAAIANAARRAGGGAREGRRGLLRGGGARGTPCARADWGIGCGRFGRLGRAEFRLCSRGCQGSRAGGVGAESYCAASGAAEHAARRRGPPFACYRSALE